MPRPPQAKRLTFAIPERVRWSVDNLEIQPGDRILEIGGGRGVAAALADARLDERFDKIFAINVNVFWLGPDQELAVIRRLLALRGRLYLFYEPPSRGQLARAAESCSRYLEAGGFKVERVLRVARSSHPGLGLVATTRSPRRKPAAQTRS